MLTRGGLLRRIDAGRIEAAIARAEARTAAEIRIAIAPFFLGGVQRTAERAFARLGMAKTRAKNGVLVFVVPSRRRFAVIGDVGVHERVGQAFWDEVSAQLGNAFGQGRYTQGLVEAIDAIADRAATLFPAQQDDNPDELPNTIAWP